MQEQLSDTSFISCIGSNKLHLFGPLHGPDWILRGSDIPHLRPVTGSNGVEGTFLWAVGLFGTVQNGATTITVMSSRRYVLTGYFLGHLGGLILVISMLSLYLQMQATTAYSGGNAQFH